MPPDNDGSDESLVVTTRGELLLPQGGIDETVVGSRLAGMGGGGISEKTSTSAGNESF